MNSSSKRCSRSCHFHRQPLLVFPLRLKFPRAGRPLLADCSMVWTSKEWVAQEPNIRSYYFIWGCGKRMRESRMSKRTTCFADGQDWPIVQGLGQPPLSLTRCRVYPAYLKPHQQLPTMELWNTRKCYLSCTWANCVALCRNAGSPTTPRATWFMYKQYICLKNTNSMETVHS